MRSLFSWLIPLWAVLLCGVGSQQNATFEHPGLKNAAIEFFDSLQKLNNSLGSSYENGLSNITIAGPLSKGLLYHSLVKQINSALLDSFGPLMGGVFNLNISSDCLLSLSDFVAAFERQETWAYRLLNSYGNAIDSGFLLGSITQLGDFDQCIETRSDTTQGQYCLVKYKLNVNINNSTRLKIKDHFFNSTGTELEGTFLEEILRYSHIFDAKFGRMGICTTSQCSTQDVQTLLDFFLNAPDATLIVSDCQTEIKSMFVDFTFAQTMIFLLLVSIVVNAVFCTILTQIFKFDEHDTSQFGAIVSNFCIFNNFRSLMRFDYANSNLSSVNGLRILTIFWIVYAHVYLLSMKESFHEAIKLMDSVYNPKLYMVYNAWPSVENYFVISAFLLSHAVFEMARSGRHVGPYFFIVHRLLRLWPSIFLIIGVIFLMPNIVQGPLWPDAVRMQIDNCYKYWWKIPLFISNFRENDEYCHAHTWYLAADTQLYFVSLIVIFAILRFGKIAVNCLTWLTVAVAVLISVVFYIFRLEPTILFDNLDDNVIYHDMIQIYMPTYYHLIPCFIGILAGIVLNEFKHRNARIPPTLNLILWILSAATIFFVLYAGFLFVHYPQIPLFLKSVYAGFYRFIWSLTIAFIIVSCELKQGGVIGRFLSHKMFVPLSKLNYLLYLIHFVVTWARADSIRSPLVFSNCTMLNEFIINLTWSYALAVVCYVLVESPFAKQKKLILLHYLESEAEKTEDSAVPTFEANKPVEANLPNVVIESEECLSQARYSGLFVRATQPCKNEYVTMTELERRVAGRQQADDEA